MWINNQNLGSLGAMTQAQAEADVTAAFQSLFGRTPAASGLAFWANALVAGSVTESNLAAQILASASPTDLAYYNAHHGGTTPTPTPAPLPTMSPTAVPAPVGLTPSEAAQFNAAAASGGYDMTPGVSDYAQMQKEVYVEVGQGHGTLSVPQVWVASTGHTDQYWQEVQAAYNAGKNPTPTTFKDTWLSTVGTAAVPVGSPQAIANMQQVLPVYKTFLTNAGESPQVMAIVLAQSGIDINGNPIPVTGSTTSAPTPTPTATPGSVHLPPAPAGTPAASGSPVQAPIESITQPTPTPIQQIPTPTPATIPTASNIGATSVPSVLNPTASLGPSQVSYTPSGSPPASGGYAPSGNTNSGVATPGTMGISPMTLALVAAGLVLITHKKSK